MSSSILPAKRDPFTPGGENKGIPGPAAPKGLFEHIEMLLCKMGKGLGARAREVRPNGKGSLRGGFGRYEERRVNWKGAPVQGQPGVAIIQKRCLPDSIKVIEPVLEKGLALSPPTRERFNLSPAERSVRFFI
ncbi:MAG: hypothetical protein P8Z49_12720 [Acidobacteriota bacterium]